MPDAIEIFPWNDNFATGIPEIDAQHRRLVDLLNVLAGHLAFNTEVTDLSCVFDELTDYARVHFAFEERIWADAFSGDEWEERHRATHGGFVQEVVALKSLPGSAEAAEATIFKVVTFLTHWLALHIIESDKRMAKAVMGLASGLSLSQAKERADAEMSGSTRVLIDTIMGMYDKLATRTLQMAREIRLRAQVEADLKATQAELMIVRDQALAASAAKSRFLSTVTHELRTPLNSIIGFSSLLQAEPTHPSGPEWLERVVGASVLLLKVISDVLDLSKIEAESMKLTQEPFEVGALVDEVVGLTAAAAQAKGLGLTATTGQLPAGQLVGDPTRLKQCLLNLVGNAIKFTPAGSVSIRTDVVESARNGVLLRFQVADTGIGIPQAVLPELFSPFQQADASHAKLYGGTGLGLAITKALAQAMGGDVGASSAEGAGSTFWFTARLARAAADQA